MNYAEGLHFSAFHFIFIAVTGGGGGGGGGIGMKGYDCVHYSCTQTACIACTM